MPAEAIRALTSIGPTFAQFVVPVCAVEDQTWVPRTGAPVVVSTNAYRTTFPPAGAPYVTTFQDKLSCAVKGGDPLTVKGW